MVRIRTCLLGSAGALAAGLFWSGSALAFCNEVAASTPNGYDPAEAGCFNPVTDAGVQVPSLFWRNMCVSYSLQQDASIFVTLKQATDVAAQAFETWHNAPCDDAGGTPSIQAYDFGPVMCDQTPSNEHNNPIIFRDSSWGTDQANALGLTTLTVVPRTGELLGAAIEINASRVPLVVNTDAGIPDGAYDLQSIITHEAGHFLGLAHSQHTDAVMYAYYHAGQSALTPDDINGICPIYPPNGTRNTTVGTLGANNCDPEPPLGFLSACGQDDAGVFITGSGPVEGGGDPECASDDCSIGRGAHPGGTGAAIAGVMSLAALLRRSRRRRASHRTKWMAFGAALPLVALGAGDAHASVSIRVFFQELVQKSSAVAVVTPFEQRSIWENGIIVTLTHLHVDRRIAGDVTGEPWVRTRGGTVGDVQQIVEGQATFDMGHPSLVFLRPYVDPDVKVASGALAVVEAGQGQFPIESSPKQVLRLAMGKDLGVLFPPQRAAPGDRPAEEVLSGRSIDDAAKEVTAAWSRLHER